MIVKLPVYFEVEINLPPDQVDLFLQHGQAEFTKFVQKSMSASYLDFSYGFETYKMVLLTAAQVKNRLVKQPGNMGKK